MEKLLKRSSDKCLPLSWLDIRMTGGSVNSSGSFYGEIVEVGYNDDQSVMVSNLPSAHS